MPKFKKHHYIASLVLLMLIAGAVLVLRTDITVAQSASPPTVVTSIYRVDNPIGANAFSATTTNSATFPFTVSSADVSQLLIVAAHGEKNDSTGCSVSGITYNGTPLTQSVASSSKSTGYNNCVALWYLDNPSVGTSNVVITWAGTGIVGKAASAVLFSGAGNAPDATGIGISCGPPSASCAISSASVTTITTNSVVLDAATTGNAGSGVPSSGAGQTTLHTGFNQGTYDIRFGMSTKSAPTPGAVTTTWTGTYNRTAHVALAVPPAFACSNGTDDDADGYIDILDPGCSGTNDDDETNTVPTTFSVNDFVKVTVASTNVYPSGTGNLSPTSNMTSSGTQSLNAAGKVAQTVMYGFTGAPSYGGGSWYWRINFGTGTDGWVNASNLVKVCDGSFPANTFEACYFDGVSTANINSISPPTLPGSAVLLAQQSTTTISSPIGTLYPAYSMNWGQTPGTVIPTATSSYVYVIYRGKINLSGGSYIFHTYSDDGVKLFVNGATHINDWGVNSPIDNYSIATTTLSGSTDVELWYREDSGGALLNFGWTRYDACSDGIDNDGDGKIDQRPGNADPGCTGPTDNDETDVAVTPQIISSNYFYDNPYGTVNTFAATSSFSNDFAAAPFTVPGGYSDTLMIVVAYGERNNAQGCSTQRVAYGVQEFVPYTATTTLNNGSNNCVSIWYLDSPSPGSNSVAITWSSTGVDGKAASIVLLADAANTPNSWAAGNACWNSGCSIRSAVVGVTAANSLVLDAFATGNINSAPVLGAGQTLIHSQQNSGSLVDFRFGMSHETASVPGNVTMSWNDSSGYTYNRTAHIALAIPPASYSAGLDICSDGIDNDADGRIDYGAGANNDPGCSSGSDNNEISQCGDAIDNDNDTFTDLNDAGCAGLWDNNEANVSACSDDADNDGDNLTDYPADPGCVSADDANEANVSLAECADGIDNDGDGYIDIGEPGCTSATDDSEYNRVSRVYSLNQRVIVVPPNPIFTAVVNFAGGCQINASGFGECFGNPYPEQPGNNEKGSIANSTPIFWDSKDSGQYGRGAWYWEVDLDSVSFLDGYLVEDGIRAAAQCEDGRDNEPVGQEDGLKDYPADPDCSSASDQSEYNPIHEITGWAWSAWEDQDGKAQGIGWISFSNPSGSGIDYGVDVAENGELSGYAWSGGGRGTSTSPDLGTGIGWISFNKADLGGCPKAPCEAHLATTTGKVTGWARACVGTYTTSNSIAGTCATAASRSDGWDGWISLSKQANESIEYGVTVSGCNYSGWAWGGDVIGWISFSGNQYSTLQYGVTGVGDGCQSPDNNLVSCDWINDPANGQYVVDLAALTGEAGNKNLMLSRTSDRFLNSRYISTTPGSYATAATTSKYAFSSAVPPGYYDIWLAVYDDHTVTETSEPNESAYINLFASGQSTPTTQSSSIFDIQDMSPWLYKITSKVDQNKYINTAITDLQFVHASYPSGGFPTTGDNDFWALCALLREVGPSFEIKLSTTPSTPTSLAVVKPADETTGSWKSNPLAFSVQRNGGFTGNISLTVDSIYVKCVDDDEWCIDAEGDTLIAGTDYSVQFQNNTATGILSGADLDDELTLTISGQVIPGKYGVKLKGWDSAGCAGPTSCPNQDTIEIDLDIRPDKLYSPR